MKMVGRIKGGKFAFSKRLSHKEEKTIKELLDKSKMLSYIGEDEQGDGEGQTTKKKAGYFVATVIPNPEDYAMDDKYREEQYTTKECESLNLSKLPLSLSHYDEIFKDVGRVRNNFIHGKTQKDLMVTGELDKTTEGYFSVNALLEGLYEDVSMQHESTTYYNSNTIVKNVKEISLCPEGARHGSHVYLVGTNIKRDPVMKTSPDEYYIYAHLNNINGFRSRKRPELVTPKENFNGDYSKELSYEKKRGFDRGDREESTLYSNKRIKKTTIDNDTRKNQRKNGPPMDLGLLTKIFQKYTHK